MALVQQAVKILQEAAAKCDPSSDLGQSILQSVQKLGKHAPPNQATQGIQAQTLRNLADKARQQAPLMALMRSMGQGGAPGGMPGSPMGAPAGAAPAPPAGVE
jgi:hypothetical protein